MAMLTTCGMMLMLFTVPSSAQSGTSCQDQSDRRRSGYSCRVLGGYESKPEDGGKYIRNYCGIQAPQMDSDLGEEARTTCCQTCATAPVNIAFGGSKHSVSFRGILNRPEFVKAERCTDTLCSECTDSSSCWHGSGRIKNGEEDMDWNAGWQKIEVPANSQFTTFAFTARATCHQGTSHWKFGLGSRTKLVNAKIKVYLDSNLYREYETLSWGGDTIPFTPTSGTHIRFVLVPVEKSQASIATLWLETDKVDKTVDDCMSMTNCLKEFADESANEAQFELRNSNEKQLACLLGKGESAEDEVCRQWVQCISDKQKFAMIALLKAVGTPSSGGGGGKSGGDGAVCKDKGGSAWCESRKSKCHKAFMIKKCKRTCGICTSMLAGKETLSEDPNACMNPASADPEEWDCDCIEKMKGECDGKNDKDCFKRLICGNPRVCQTWKDAQNCEGLLLLQVNDTAAATRRGLMRREKQRSLKSDESLSQIEKHSLDASLGDKCF